jgi:hypothetical protein
MEQNFSTLQATFIELHAAYNYYAMKHLENEL